MNNRLFYYYNIYVFSPTAFAELQTNVTDLTHDLAGTGMPFVSHRQYATNMLFTGLDIQPTTSDPEVSKK